MFDAIEVDGGQPLLVTIQGGQSGLAVVNGMQLLKVTDDGIPEAWRQLYFGNGHASDPRATTIADPDGDGANNYQEFLAGTNPLDARSVQTVPLYVNTYAGSDPGGQDGFRNRATFVSPVIATYDLVGRLWVAEATLTGYTGTLVGSHRLRVMDKNEVFVTVAGGAEPGFVEGPGLLARFAIPNAIAFDHRGNAFVADRANHRIRKIDPNGVVSTFAGSQAGFRDGPGVEALFDTPICVVSDSGDNLYVADWNNLRIRKITPAGLVTTFAGGVRGSEDGPLAMATFNSPNGLAFGADGSLFVSDWDNGRASNQRWTGHHRCHGHSLYRWHLYRQSRNVYAVSSGARFLAKYFPNGTLSWSVPQTDGFQDGPIGLARFTVGPPTLLPDGTLVAADSGNHRLRQFIVGVPPLLTISPERGSFTNAFTVTLSTTVSGAVTRYSLQGAEPDANAALYSGPFTIHDTTTVKARLFVNGLPISPVVSATFTNLSATLCAASPIGLVAWGRRRTISTISSAATPACRAALSHFDLARSAKRWPSTGSPGG